jgi:hypothetical protein
MTITIKINNAKALKLLEDLESLNLIEVIKKSIIKSKKEKLSERLLGSITSKQANIMRGELDQMRNEWNRNI